MDGIGKYFAQNIDQASPVFNTVALALKTALKKTIQNVYFAQPTPRSPSPQTKERIAFLKKLQIDQSQRKKRLELALDASNRQIELEVAEEAKLELEKSLQLEYDKQKRLETLKNKRLERELNKTTPILPKLPRSEPLFRKFERKFMHEIVIPELVHRKQELAHRREYFFPNRSSKTTGLAHSSLNLAALSQTERVNRSKGFSKQLNLSKTIRIDPCKFLEVELRRQKHSIPHSLVRSLLK